MTDEPTAPEAPPVLLKKKKKKDRLRSAWISFTGRIIAQLVGAAATVVLGVIVLHKAQAGRTVVETQPSPVEVASTTAVPERARGEASIAVLPFQNYSGDPRHEHFADAITETLTSELAQFSTLRVVSRTSSAQYKGQPRPLPDIARALGANFIVEGSVVKVNGRLRVVAQLIDGNTDQHVWARTYDRPIRDVLSVEAEVAKAIAADLNAAMTPKRQPRLTAQVDTLYRRPSF